MAEPGTGPPTGEPNEKRGGETRADDETKKTGFHHRLYPYMDSLVQYAVETVAKEPWIVRNRSDALRAERQGQGKALVRTWVPTDWVYVNEEEK